jgi:hypothetical protein
LADLFDKESELHKHLFVTGVYKKDKTIKEFIKIGQGKMDYEVDEDKAKEALFLKKKKMLMEKFNK